tara:strand:- start:562 stop:1026 length:465 start_codon:yes stop_codon:yes gene_type:complete
MQAKSHSVCSKFLKKMMRLFKVLNMKKSKYDKKIIERREKVHKRKLFTLVPIEIAEDKSLKLNEKFILSEITTMQVYAGEFHATNQYLADLLGLSRSSISRIINDLRDRGYIKSYQHYDPVDKFTHKRTLHANVFLDCEVFKSHKKLKIFDQED